MVQTVRDTSQRVDRTDHAHGAFVQDMRADHGGLDVGVAEKLLHRANVLAGFHQMGGEAVPKAVGREANRQPGLPYGSLHRALDALFVNVVPLTAAAGSVARRPGESFEAYHASSIGVICLMIAWKLWGVKRFF